MTSDDALPRALEMLWRESSSPTKARGLTRERIVDAAIEIADADGLSALSMARLAERLGCGTMSLYRHVANKDELVVLMLSKAAQPAPVSRRRDWRKTLSAWADALWEIYHRHPWILQAAASGPPADPGQLAWLNNGLAALGSTGLSERDKLTAVTAVLHFVRGAAALDIEAGQLDYGPYPELLRRLITRERFPALAATLDAGVFDRADSNPQSEFHSGLGLLLDGIAAKLKATT
jgi:AcrR family transcriptional regulator